MLSERLVITALFSSIFSTPKILEKTICVIIAAKNMAEKEAILTLK
jgi:hypothetical protein